MNQENSRKGSQNRILFAQRFTYILLSIILFLYGLIAVKNFLYPIAFGFLLAYLVYPIANWLEKNRLPRILANFITIIGALGILVGLALFGYSKLVPVAGELPELADTAVKNLSAMLANIGQYMGFEKSETKQIIQDQGAKFLESSGEYIQGIFSSTASTAVAIGLLPVYVFLFLYYRTKFAYFLLKIVPPSRKRETVAILREISKVAARYMGGVLIVVLILCIINSLGLWIIGMKYAIPLGIMSAVFNFIPYFGTLLGGLVPFMFAILVENNPGLGLRVILLFIIIQFVENNLLTPNIVGGNVKVNPFFIITGLVAASMIWGIPGMLLIVPFLAIIRIIFSHIDSMRPFAFLLGQEGTAKHSITFQKFKDLFSKKKTKKTN